MAILRMCGLRSSKGWKMLELKMLESARDFWDVVLLTCASWGSPCWKFLRFCVDVAHHGTVTCVSFKSPIDEAEDPCLAPERSTAHGMDHTERHAMGDVALPLRSGRGQASDWRETRPNFLAIP